jgi:hypothetical protein
VEDSCADACVQTVGLAIARGLLLVEWSLVSTMQCGRSRTKAMFGLQLTLLGADGEATQPFLASCLLCSKGENIAAAARGY